MAAIPGTSELKSTRLWMLAATRAPKAPAGRESPLGEELGGEVFGMGENVVVAGPEKADECRLKGAPADAYPALGPSIGKRLLREA
ncbi:hypothetical protein OUZ56_032463 [Daphnia magna]|uniref:Uncharacterized protein n=1 Tax=Daphnia magna TaxID=35525 RepID=A0ABR0B8Z4_9CRUS|nr:hypothetical protein OUZ56_032463 [Daphnia magna]